MKKPEWPGIATAVGCILILTLVVLAARSEFELQKWQTLMASLIALGGATLAYRGVLARMDYDRSVIREADLRRKFGLATRLQFSIKKIQMEAVLNIASLQRSPPTFTLKKIESMEADLMEAWDNMDHLPKPIAYNIGQIRIAIAEVQIWVRVDPEDPAWAYGANGEEPGLVKQVREAIEHIETVATILSTQLSSYGGGLTYKSPAIG